MKKIEQLVENKGCVGCGSCLASCPTDSIKMVSTDGFFYPVINHGTCIDCNKCTNACAIDNENRNFHAPLVHYAAYADKASMPEMSTSGGICALASRYYLNQGNQVVAARFAEDWTLQHDFADLSNMHQYDGSKYYQSIIKDEVYKKIGSSLKNNLKVLFIGTPCQVAGLYAYAEANNVPLNNLVTIDFLCHGVPSPIIGKMFVSHLDDKRKIQSYNFRSKKYGWGKKYRTVKYMDGKEKTVICNSCQLHSWFGKHLSLRQSCFNCQYRKIERISDITVADFWGVQKYYHDIDIIQGVSAVQINTELGKRLFDDIKEHLKTREVSQDSIWENRKTGLSNFPKPDNYEEFWKIAAKMDIELLMKKFPAESELDRMKQRFSRMFKR